VFLVVSYVKGSLPPPDPRSSPGKAFDAGTKNAFYDEIVDVKEPELETAGVSSGGFRTDN